MRGFGHAVDEEARRAGQLSSHFWAPRQRDQEIRLFSDGNVSNYFNFDLGDYAKKTSHLTLVEDALYMRLLRRYYDEERPLLRSFGQVARIAGARTEVETQAVERVLHDFFVLEEDGWHQKRADEEIAIYRALAAANSVKGKKSAAARVQSASPPCPRSRPVRRRSKTVRSLHPSWRTVLDTSMASSSSNTSHMSRSGSAATSARFYFHRHGHMSQHYTASQPPLVDEALQLRDLDVS